MIDVALIEIIKKLNTYLQGLSSSAEAEVILGSISLIDAFQDTSSQGLNEKIIASVINIEQEATLRNMNTYKKAMDNSGKPISVKLAPEVCLNIFVLFAANKSPKNYGTALQRISQIIGFFQRQHVFTSISLPELGTAGIEKLIWDLHTLRFEELNHLWSINGGKYIPSVLYKMRMLVIQESLPADVEVITGVATNPEYL